MTTAADIQREHKVPVLTGQVLAERRWGQPCLAYSACVQPGMEARADLSGVQESVLSLEPSLLRVPERALHANLVWLLPVHQEFDRTKDELWDLHLATDSAIIAVAEEPNGLSALRRKLMSALSVPGSLSAGDLVHTTLFRYARPLRDPATLMRRLAAGVHVDVDVYEVLVVRERIFPSLDYEVLRRVVLGHGRQPV